MSLPRIQAETIDGQLVSTRNGQPPKLAKELQDKFKEEWKMFYEKILSDKEIYESFLRYGICSNKEQVTELIQEYEDLLNKLLKHKDDWKEIGKTKYL